MLDPPKNLCVYVFNFITKDYNFNENEFERLKNFQPRKHSKLMQIINQSINAPDK